MVRINRSIEDIGIRMIATTRRDCILVMCWQDPDPQVAVYFPTLSGTVAI
jgi:hypothetical protein